MLVKVDDRAELSAAEQEFVQCLRNCSITGLALVDLRIGTQRGTRQISAVIWTTQGILVVEALGFRSRQGGVLTVSADQPWRVGAAVADLDLDLGVNAIARLEGAVGEVQSAFARTQYDPGQICGAVVLVPHRGVVLRPGRETVRPGIDVVVTQSAETTELRIFLENFAPGPPRWTRGRVSAATQALIGWSPDRAELADAGFAEKIADPIERRFPGTQWRLSGRLTDLLGWGVLVVAVSGMLVVLVAIVGSLMADAPAAGPAAPPTSTVEPTVPAPAGPVECWPLQPDC